MFRLKEGSTQTDQEAVKEGLLELARSVPEIRSYEIGQDLLLESGQKHPFGPNRHVAWTAIFDNTQDYQTYNESSAHQEFLALLKPLVDGSSRAAIQYDRDD
mgnify:CR=1 FL=1